MTYTYKPSGICAQKIDIVLENDIIQDVLFLGGCNGNHQGITKLLTGMKATEAIAKLGGINCGTRGTSCPDQLSKALTEALSAVATAATA